MTQTVSFSSDAVGERTQLLTLDGRCDRSTALQAEQLILSALGARRTEIIFDLRGVISLDHSMLRVLSRGSIEAKARHGRLALVRPNPHVWALFEQRGLGRVFPSFLGLEGALAKLPT